MSNEPRRIRPASSGRTGSLAGAALPCAAGAPLVTTTGAAGLCAGLPIFMVLSSGLGGCLGPSTCRMFRPT